MRRAQRAYRTRKEEILISEKARSEQLSKALDDAIETFISFHRHVYGFHQTRHSPGLLFHLNQAFMQINAIAQSANREAHFTHFPRSSQTSNLSPFHQAPEAMPLVTATTAVLPDERDDGLGLMPISVPYQSTRPTSEAKTLFLRTGSSSPAAISERIYRACLERVVFLLASDCDLLRTDLSLPSYQDVHVPHLASKITLDLDKLVQHLAANATCLGPVPGIRKAAVDSSIRESIITV